jgi:hypothetical protein
MRDGLRGNSPLPADFGVLNAPQDIPAKDKVTAEHIALAKAAKTKDGKIIVDHLMRQVKLHTDKLMTTNFAGVDPATAMAIVMASQETIAIFQGVLRDIETAKEVVRDATARSR